MSITINPKRVLINLLIIITILVIINLIGHYRKFGIDDRSVSFIDIFILDRWFNLEYERSVPTLYATLTLILTSVLLFIIGKFHKISKTPYILWYVLGAIFCFLSLDEFLSIHERLIGPFRNNFSTTGILYYAWIIPYAIALLIIGIMFSKFLYRLPKNFRFLFILSGFIFVGGAMGMEMVGGYYLSNNDQSKSFTYSIFMSIEETLEMIGIAIFLYTLLLYLSTQFPDNKFKIN